MKYYHIEKIFEEMIEDVNYAKMRSKFFRVYTRKRK